MPSLQQKVENAETNPPLLRILSYGSPKTKKTWHAATAAEAGFNVVLLDSDHGYHILLKTLNAEAQKRLMIIEARDSLKIPTAANFMTRFLKFGWVNFNEKTRSVVTDFKSLDSNCIQLSSDSHLSSNTVLIVDSYTALVRSLQMSFQKDNSLDPSASFDPKKPGIRDSFGWTGSLASWMLEKLCGLPCHVIIIAHKSVYEKYSKDQKTIEWTRVQIKSTSGPHAMTIGDKFSDILFFENVSSAVTKISTRAEKDQEGGSRLIPPNVYNWDKLSFSHICEYAGIPLPSKDLPYLDFKIPTKEATPTPKKPEINVTKTPLSKIPGLVK